MIFEFATSSFDMEMGRAAGMATLGVSWGYHPAERLSEASMVVHNVSDLIDAVPTALGGIT